MGLRRRLMLLFQLVLFAFPVRAAATEPDRLVAVRVGDSQNLVFWGGDPEISWTIKWRAPTTGESGIAEGVSSPWAHDVADKSISYVYVLSKLGSDDIIASASSLIFEHRVVGRYMMLTLGDINQDGCLDVLGTVNDCNGNLVPVEYEDVGLGALRRDGRNFRDARLADFNGDGFLDLVSNSYNKYEDVAPPSLLHFGGPSGHFVRDPTFEEHDIKGYGETIVVADFDGSGSLDIFIPYYSHESEKERSYLLLNDGFGRFEDVAEEAGVALRNVPINRRVEGAQAIDFDMDGDLDLAVSSTLFVNRLTETGELGFEPYGSFPVGFDEGLKFLDWNNDGRFDVVLQRPYNDIGPVLYEFDGAEFVEVPDAFPEDSYYRAYGINAYDVNADGLDDVVASGDRIQEPGELHYPRLFINTGSGFIKHHYVDASISSGHDISAFGDFNGDGRPDMVARYGNGLVLINESAIVRTISIELLGSLGEQNQHGHVVLIRRIGSSEVMARVVDSGSGYLSNNQYPILAGLPDNGSYTLEAIFDDRSVIVEGVTRGDRVKIYEDGRSEVRSKRRRAVERLR